MTKARCTHELESPFLTLSFKGSISGTRLGQRSSSFREAISGVRLGQSSRRHRGVIPGVRLGQFPFCLTEGRGAPGAAVFSGVRLRQPPFLPKKKEISGGVGHRRRRLLSLFPSWRELLCRQPVFCPQVTSVVTEKKCVSSHLKNPWPPTSHGNPRRAEN